MSASKPEQTFIRNSEMNLVFNAVIIIRFVRTCKIPGKANKKSQKLPKLGVFWEARKLLYIFITKMPSNFSRIYMILKLIF